MSTALKSIMCNLDMAYDFVIKYMRDASIEFSDSSGVSKNFLVTGWNELCKGPYKLAGWAFVECKINGKIRTGENFETMKFTRYRFKTALKYCKANEREIKKALSRSGLY